jgi:hypothetical protein
MERLARDRRFDHLYDRQRQPVKDFILDRFAEEVAGELSAWPPPVVEWVSEELRARWSGGLAAPPREAVLRFALELSRLDLAREYDAAERLLAGEGRRRLQSPQEEAACHLLVRFVTEKALALKEWAEGARLTRDDLVALVGRIERRLFLVT